MVTSTIQQPKPKAIIFDWDNTLVDTWPIIYSALLTTFEQFKIEPWTLEMVKSNVKQSMRDAFPLVFGEEWQAAATVYQQAYRASVLDNLFPIEGAEQTLKQLQLLKIPMFLVSNKKGDNLRAELKHMGWEHYFLGAAGSGDSPADKPDIQHVLHAITPHGYPDAKDMWFIGDTDVDLHCAKNSGCKAILFGEHAGTLPGYTITSLAGFEFIHHPKNHGELQALLNFLN